MTTAEALIFAHVGAGGTWLAVSTAIVVRRVIGRWLMIWQAGASALTLVAGILLWRTLHSTRMGPAEHWLVVGSFCAFVAIGLQSGVVLAGTGGRLSAAQLTLHAASVVCLVVAATAMVASTFAA